MLSGKTPHMCRTPTVFLVCALAAAPAAAQTPTAQVNALKALTLEELSQVEVTATAKVAEPLWTTPAAIYVLTAADIERSGVTALPDALRLVPGVEVARVDTSRNWVVGIRGFGDQYSKSVLVMIDGRHAYTPLWAGVHWPIQDVVLEDIERIEVIRGPGGTVWGTNAQNGVINIVTRSASQTQGALVSVTGGTIDRTLVTARYGGRRGRLAYRVYGKGTRREPQADITPAWDTWAMGQAGGRLDWEGGRDTVTVQGDGYVGELGERVLVHDFRPAGTRVVNDPVDLRGANLLARWQRRLPRQGTLALTGYVDHTYRLGTDFGERRTTADVDLVHRWRPTPRHEIVWGAGGRTSPSRLIQTYAFSDFQPQRHTFNVFSVFAQDTLTLVRDRLLLTGGLKAEHNTYAGWQLQPSVRAMWTPSTRRTLWAAVTRAVRTPSRVDEDISVTFFARAEPLLYGVLSGNRDLIPESTLGTELGYRTLLGSSWFLDVAAFTNRYDDVVDLGPGRVESRVTEGVPYTALVFPWINGNEGRTQGVELSPEWHPHDALQVRAAYSYVHTDLDAKPVNTRPVTLPTLEGSTPRHQVSLRASLSLGPVQLDPTYRYVSARTSLAVPAYHTADIRLAVPLRGGLVLSVVGQNLLQRTHVEWARDPGPSVPIQRAGYVRLLWRP